MRWRSRADQHNVTLDGIDVNDPQLQAAYTSAVRMTQDALEEFRVSTSNYSAEIGRSSGAQVSLVTKSGTNQFDGSGYWSAPHADLVERVLPQAGAGLAKKPSVAPKLDKDSFGGALGGPVSADRFFFFGNFEKFKENSESPVLRYVPSDSFRDGVIMYRCEVGRRVPRRHRAGLHRQPRRAAGLVRPVTARRSRRSTRSASVRAAPSSHHFSQYPLPNDPGLDGTNIMDYRFAAPIANHFNTFIGRLDFRAGNNQSLFVRVNMQDDTIDSRAAVSRAGAAARACSKNWGFAIGYDRAIGSSLVNTFRYGLTKIDEARPACRRATRCRSDSSATSTRSPHHPSRDPDAQHRQRPVVAEGQPHDQGRDEPAVDADPEHAGQRDPVSTSINPSWVSGSADLQARRPDLHDRGVQRGSRPSPPASAPGTPTRG